MQRDLPTIRWTRQDLFLLPEDRNRHELIEGHHYVTPAPNVPHQTAVANLLRCIAAFLRGGDLGRVWPAPIDVVLSEHDVVQPDLVFVTGERREIVLRTHIAGAPDLVAEVLSDATRSRDETTKRRLYEKHGVREYWLVDPDARTVAVLRRRSGAGFPARERVLGGSALLSTPLLPGFEVAVVEIFQ